MNNESHIGNDIVSRIRRATISKMFESEPPITDPFVVYRSTNINKFPDINTVIDHDEDSIVVVETYITPPKDMYAINNCVEEILIYIGARVMLVSDIISDPRALLPRGSKFWVGGYRIVHVSLANGDTAPILVRYMIYLHLGIDIEQAKLCFRFGAYRPSRIMSLHETKFLSCAHAVKEWSYLMENKSTRTIK